MSFDDAFGHGNTEQTAATVSAANAVIDDDVFEPLTEDELAALNWGSVDAGRPPPSGRAPDLGPPMSRAEVEAAVAAAAPPAAPQGVQAFGELPPAGVQADAARRRAAMSATVVPDAPPPQPPARGEAVSLPFSVAVAAAGVVVAAVRGARAVAEGTHLDSRRAVELVAEREVQTARAIAVAEYGAGEGRARVRAAQALVRSPWLSPSNRALGMQLGGPSALSAPLSRLSQPGRTLQMFLFVPRSWHPLIVRFSGRVSACVSASQALCMYVPMSTNPDVGRVGNAVPELHAEAKVGHLGGALLDIEGSDR